MHLLDVLAPAQARRLLLAASGRDGEDDGPDGACAAVVEACGRLPSAVRALAGRLAARPHWTVASLAARLADEHAPLAELRSAQPGLDVALRGAYDEAAQPQRRAFRLLALLPPGPFPATDAAALLGLPEPDAEAVLEGLVEARLLRAEPRGAYRLHVLWRLLAGELLTAQEPPARWPAPWPGSPGPWPPRRRRPTRCRRPPSGSPNAAPRWSRPSAGPMRPDCGRTRCASPTS